MSRAKYNRLHYLTAQSKTLKKLRESPQRSVDMTTLPEGGPSRDLVCKLTSSGNSNGTTKNRGKIHTIIYMYGDERRAVRKFIEVNYDFVESCIGDAQHPLMDWDPVLYQILLEEWDFQMAEEPRE